ncbi:hypothetical protein [Streptomonospora alba]|uniref:hypothetical protein n=1 Tax=Streptomonospora alba TaxID=183763 RepID=UPI000699FDFC|nr:hypothetical protein [Streptomonospora alba]
MFDLLGRNEVDLTAALGWALASSPRLMESLLSQLSIDAEAEDVSVALEQADAQGRTDIELTAPAAKVVIEAKQGWLVPGEAQLGKYADRFAGFVSKRLVSLSDSSQDWAKEQLPESVDDVPVVHVSWDGIRHCVRDAKDGCRGRERVWLEELETYMGSVTSRRPVEDQWVYCVVVSNDGVGGVGFQEYVTDKRVYFHPYGGNNSWPKLPPNFLCFRWDGKVRQVNRVQSCEVVADLRTRCPAITEEEAPGPHIVYHLGPDIPIPEISTKGTFASGRVWCLLDQLLTRPTLKDAGHASVRMSGK